MKEFSGVISEYNRKERGGSTYLSAVSGGYVVGTTGGTLSTATVKIGDNYLLKLEVVLGLDSYMQKARSSKKPCTLYIHRKRLIGVKLPGGETYFYRKPAILGLFLALFVLMLYYFLPLMIIILPLTILFLVIFWKVLWEFAYYLDGRKLEKRGGIPVSMYGDRLDLRSAI